MRIGEIGENRLDGLLQGGGTILQPVNVLVVAAPRRLDIQDRALGCQGRGRPVIHPFLDFGMTIGKGETGGAIMIHPGHVAQRPKRRVDRIIAVHELHEVAPID